MIFTRLGYVLIITVIAVAAVAIVVVLRPASEDHVISAQEVVNYARFGVIESIDAHGRTLTVRFKKDFDTNEAFGTNSHTFSATLGDGQSITDMLAQAGVALDGSNGLRVTAQ
ncbi:MAG TPA: hypothetical protein VFC53_13720 [Dehalococcoidia bacterium]|nr:hypothetical protein [Dehalococcoidia bacterium]